MTSQHPECSGIMIRWNVVQPSGEPVSLEENVAMISEGTTGLVTWEAALHLAEWALDNTHVFAGKYVSLNSYTNSQLGKCRYKRVPLLLLLTLYQIHYHFRAQLLFTYTHLVLSVFRSFTLKIQVFSFVQSSSSTSVAHSFFCLLLSFFFLFILSHVL